MTPQQKVLSDAAKAADTLINLLNPLHCQRQGVAQDENCWRMERDRKRRGSKRPTQYQDPKRMCNSCAASWYATMAAIELGPLMRDIGGTD